MLRSLKSMLGFSVKATDGDIGELHDVLFDDGTWQVRYGVVATGGWLLGRKVLLSPMSFGIPAWDSRRIPVMLTKEKVQGSPDIDTNLPVSRQQRVLLDGYYGWSAAASVGGLGPVPFVPAPIPEAEQKELAAMEENADPHLRSAKEVIGYYIQARDGEIGHVEDFLLDDRQWRIAFMVVDTRNWLAGRKVLVSPGWAKEIQWASRKVSVDCPQETVRTSPEYDPAALVDRDYEARLHAHYGRTGARVSR